jgi:hypothetical protein
VCAKTSPKGEGVRGRGREREGEEQENRGKRGNVRVIDVGGIVEVFEAMREVDG